MNLLPCINICFNDTLPIYMNYLTINSLFCDSQDQINTFDISSLMQEK